MNRVKKGVIKEFFSEIVVVLVRKGSYTTYNIVKDTEDLGKEREHPKNVIQKSWSAKKNFRPPQTRRQVSATGISEEKSLSRSWIVFCLGIAAKNTSAAEFSAAEDLS